ncbi:MAG TPA: pyruvate kinase [Cytophagales bacterium]|nr:pyruvate kinase [Cytophagales bacterium]
MNVKFTKTKIVATVGPASNSKEKLLELIQAGVDVFRLNFSHGSHEDHQKVIENVRSLNEEHNLNICLLQDLQGPKIRTREVENNGVELVPGEKLIITMENVVGNSTRISSSYTALAEDVQIGDTILIDDGKIELKVIEKKGKDVTTVIIYGGLLKSKKGINLPDSNVSAPSLTEKDYEDLMFGIKNNVDWVALSFVRKAEDVKHLKEIIKKNGSQTRVIAKIEKPEALKNIDEIIEVSDALMVARGDLGVEIPSEEVPIAQKMIVKKCNIAGKPVIVATQMMESMITNPRPTRAETNDVANAVMDGADCVMLSAETASGLYPVLTVKSMAKTIQSIEDNGDVFDKYYPTDEKSENYYSDSLISSACILAKDTGAKAIVGMSRTGYTGFKISSHRPKANIFVFTDNKSLLNTMNLIWGVRGIYFDKVQSVDETFNEIKNILIKAGHLTPGDAYVVTANLPIKDKLRTNMLKIDVVV